MLLDGRDRVLDLVDDVEGVGEAAEREDDADQRGGQVVPVGGGALERVVKVGAGVWYPGYVAAEDDQAGDADEDEGEHLEDAEYVDGPQGILVVRNDACCWD